jgi:glycosyltransferase involved in cell wall biosynthesis
MPLVSVVLTSYNLGKFLRESIDSVLAQTFSDFELIIWDDFSSDDSWEIITGYSDPRIKSFRNDRQRRAVYGINKSISEVARGKYIATHNSDDVWEPEKLEKQVRFMNENPSIGAVFTNVLTIGEDGGPLKDRSHFYSTIFEQPNRSRHEWLHHFFYHGNALCHPSVLIRKECYDKVGLYRIGLAQLYDLDMWIRLCLEYEIHVLPEKLFRFRVRDGEMNVSGDRPETRNRTEFEFYDLLRYYRSLDTFDKIMDVFPEAGPYSNPEGFEARFVLAMMALHEKMAFPSGKLFGLKLLLELFRDEATAREVERLYSFDQTNLIAFTGKHAIFALASYRDIDRQNMELRNELQLIQSTVSFRVVQKLRNIRWLMTGYRFLRWSIMCFSRRISGG